MSANVHLMKKLEKVLKNTGQEFIQEFVCSLILVYCEIQKTFCEQCILTTSVEVAGWLVKQSFTEVLV